MSHACDRCDPHHERDPEADERAHVLLGLYRAHLAEHGRQPTRDEVSAMIAARDAEIERRDAAAWTWFTDPDRRRDERREAI